MQLRPLKTDCMKTILIAAICVVVLLVVARAFASDGQKTPAVGEAAPLVAGVDQDGKPWKLSDLVGQKIVLLYFYPKDDTTGCTKEACGLRDRMGELQTNNVQVVGVSFDSVASHQKFIAKYNLNFPLLADTDGKITDAYGARFLGRMNMARRVSFLIGLDGKIAHVTDAKSAETHLAEMREAIAAPAKK